MQLWLFYWKTVCDLPNWHVIWNIKWPDISFGNTLINFLNLSATRKATSYITVMQHLLIWSQFCASQGHRLQKADTDMSRGGDIFIITSSGSLTLPAISLCYSLFLSPTCPHRKKKPLKLSFIGRKKKKKKELYMLAIWNCLTMRNFWNLFLRMFLGKVNEWTGVSNSTATLFLKGKVTTGLMKSWGLWTKSKWNFPYFSVQVYLNAVYIHKTCRIQT